MTATARLPRTIRNPYRVPLPAVISFSGGRTSAFMLKKIVDAFGGRLPGAIHVVYANTGMEREETLQFVDVCGRAWGVQIAWVEYLWDAPHRTRVVDFATASRKGEPYAALIDRKGFVPSVTIRTCSGFLYGELTIKEPMSINLLWRVELLWSRTASHSSRRSYHN